MLCLRFVKQDQVVVARLETAGVICLETFKDFPRMARFILRDEGVLWSVSRFVCMCLSMLFVVVLVTFISENVH